jgi:hypothetical protein
MGLGFGVFEFQSSHLAKLGVAVIFIADVECSCMGLLSSCAKNLTYFV